MNKTLKKTGCLNLIKNNGIERSVICYISNQGLSVSLQLYSADDKIHLKQGKS